MLVRLLVAGCWAWNHKQAISDKKVRSQIFVIACEVTFPVMVERVGSPAAVAAFGVRKVLRHLWAPSPALVPRSLIAVCPGAWRRGRRGRLPSGLVENILDAGVVLAGVGVDVTLLLVAPDGRWELQLCALGYLREHQLGVLREHGQSSAVPAG